MPADALHLSSLCLVDLSVVVLAAAGVVATLRRGGGLLAAVGSVLGTLLVTWIVAVAVITFGPPSWARVTQDSALIHAAPVPQRALGQVGIGAHGLD